MRDRAARLKHQPNAPIEQLFRAFHVVWPSSRNIPSGQDIIPALKVSVEPGMAHLG
jgi:hypothetical protein